MESTRSYGLPNLDVFSGMQSPDNSDRTGWVVIYRSEGYGPTTEESICRRDNGETIFPSRAEAKEYVNQKNSEPMYLSHNEYSYSYHVSRADSRRARRAGGILGF